LITIKTDVALPFEFDALTLKPRDLETLRPLFERYAFRTWLRELDAAATEGAPTPEQDCSGDHRAHYETILTEAALVAWIARLEAATAFALDTETTGLNPMQAELVGISFATEPGVAAYVPPRCPN
jgi:DNA polymerase-1